MSSLQGFVTITLVAALAYLAIASLATAFAAVRAGGRREDAPESEDTLAASRLTMPVSIIVPANSAAEVSGLVHALLDLAYPEFEVIAVVDAPFGSLADLSTEWQLESREFFFRCTLETAPVRRIFRSVRDARLMVIEKDPDTRADALNCGVNLARYRFVAVVPPGVTFDRSALLRAMTPALEDPVSVIGVGSDVERVPAEGASGRDARFQHLRSIRSLMFGRLFWSRLRRGLGPEEGVSIWRRDAVLQANGFSKSAIDPGLDMMFRLQDGIASEGRRFVRNAEPFGQAQTRSAAEAGAAVRRHRLASLQAAVTWGPGACTSQSVGPRTFAYLVGSALATPLAQAWVVVASIVGAAAGWFTWPMAICGVLMLSFGTAVVSAAALLLRGALPGAPDGRELKTLLLLAPLEVVVHKPRSLDLRR